MNPIRYGGRTDTHRHSYMRVVSVKAADPEMVVGVEYLCRCGKVRNEAQARLLRNNTLRGKAHEAAWCKRLGLRHTGGLNEQDDGLNDLFSGQAKSMATARFPSWMVRELDALRARHAHRIPILGILEAPGAARDHKPRRLIVLDEADWIALHVGTSREMVEGEL